MIIETSNETTTIDPKYLAITPDDVEFEDECFNDLEKRVGKLVEYCEVKNYAKKDSETYVAEIKQTRKTTYTNGTLYEVLLAAPAAPGETPDPGDWFNYLALYIGKNVSPIQWESTTYEQA